MDLTVKHFLGFLFLLCLTAIFFLKPYDTYNPKAGSYPQAVFEQFKSYHVTLDGVENMLSGTKGRKYKERLLIENPILDRLNDGVKERITANHAKLLFNKILFLKGDVRIIRDDGWELLTSRLTYDFEKKIYTTERDPFIVYYGDSIVRGWSLILDKGRGTILADKIDAVIDEADTKKKQPHKGR